MVVMTHLKIVGGTRYHCHSAFCISHQGCASNVLASTTLPITFGDVLQDGTTAIHLASWKGHVKALSYLLNCGANVDATTLSGQTALHEAASAGQEAACSTLLKHGASNRLTDSEFRSAADLARLNKYPHLAELLQSVQPRLVRYAMQGRGQM